MSGRTQIRTEHAGAKNHGGYNGKRKEAKTVSKHLRRQNDKRAIAVGLTMCAALAALSGCAVTDKPASDLSGAGFVQMELNAWSKANLIANDRELAERIAVNRSACANAPLCKK